MNCEGCVRSTQPISVSAGALTYDLIFLLEGRSCSRDQIPESQINPLETLAHVRHRSSDLILKVGEEIRLLRKYAAKELQERR